MPVRDRIVELRRVPAGELIPNERNWRTHPAGQRKALASMLGGLGYADALIARVGPDGRLILLDGHLRAETTPDQEVPVLVVDLDEAEGLALLASLDPLAALAETDQVALAAILGEISIEDEALSAYLGRTAGIPRVPGRTDPDEAPNPPTSPVSAPGQLWHLGDHRLLCGNATVQADVERLLGGEKPRLMLTDPPYGVNYDPKWRDEAARAGHPRFSASRLGGVPHDDRSDWTEAWMLSPSLVAYCWHGGLHASSTQRALEAAGFELRAQIIWRKDSWVISRGPINFQHEPCWYAVRKGATADWRGLPQGESSVWDVSKVGPQSDADVSNHGTQKPIELFARPMRNHEGDVFDPFVGSGTALIAAEQLERRCFAIEIEPRYCDVVIERWENFTGGKARLDG